MAHKQKKLKKKPISSEETLQAKVCEGSLGGGNGTTGGRNSSRGFFLNKWREAEGNLLIQPGLRVKRLSE